MLFKDQLFILDSYMYSINNNSNQQEMKLDISFVDAGQDAKSKLMVFAFLYYLFLKCLNRSEASNYLPQI